MDFTGTLLSVLTIPLALLNAGCGLAGLWLIMRGDWPAVTMGVLLFIGGAVIARLLSATSKGLADLAIAATKRGLRASAYLAAILSGAWPVIVIVIWEVVTLYLIHGDTGRNAIAIWVWSYGVATGIWSWQAHRADSRDRTLKGIQAYSAQLAYIILSACVLLLGWPVPVAIALMLLPMILPLVVGMLLALADRDALRDVQI